MSEQARDQELVRVFCCSLLACSRAQAPCTLANARSLWCPTLKRCQARSKDPDVCVNANVYQHCEPSCPSAWSVEHCPGAKTQRACHGSPKHPNPCAWCPATQTCIAGKCVCLAPPRLLLACLLDGMRRKRLLQMGARAPTQIHQGVRQPDGLLRLVPAAHAAAALLSNAGAIQPVPGSHDGRQVRRAGRVRVVPRNEWR